MSANSALFPSAARQNEPSMEEILASIRRIISDDTPAQQNGAAPSADEVMEDDILDLAEVATTPARPALPPVAPEPSHTLASLEHALGVAKPVEPAPVMPPPVMPAPVMPAPAPVRLVQPAPVAPPPLPAPLQSVAQLEERILSQETGVIVNQAIQSLARQTAAAPVAPLNPGRSMEEVVVDALRPVLRTWLDDHLPGIVERLVKAEIERVTRGE